MNRPFWPGDVVYLKSGGVPMTVARVMDVGVKEPYINVLLYWHDCEGRMQTVEMDSCILDRVVDKKERSMAKISESQLLTLGIPQDVIDAANQVGADLETLGGLCVKHSVTAARDFLNWLSSKLPVGKP